MIHSDSKQEYAFTFAHEDSMIQLDKITVRAGTLNDACEQARDRFESSNPHYADKYVITASHNLGPVK